MPKYISPQLSLLGLCILSLSIFTPSICVGVNLFSGKYNGFIIESPLIPRSEIFHGGPPRDGIPSIDEPKFINHKQARFLSEDDRILGLHDGVQYKAYPIRILNWHEIVNDGNILISYCPLCGTGMAFSSVNSDFGVSGLLYNSDMLLYDRDTRSLWSQILGQAISGKLKGTRLKLLPLEHTSWKDWSNRHPDTLVLSNNTGFSRNYSRSPYGNYARSSQQYFPTAYKDRRFHPKEMVIGLKYKEHVKAYPFIELAKLKKSRFTDEIAGKRVIVQFSSEYRSGNIYLDSGETIPSVTGYWFAWYAFHPDTEVFMYKD